MTCEKAERYLSAYLDDMLDPQLRQDVAAHVEGCTHCAEVLADYRRVDALLAGIERVTPADTLRDRIFGSPEFAAIMREQNGARSGHSGRTSVPLLERHTDGDADGDQAPGEAYGARRPAPLRAGRRGASPPWRRVALQTAAVLALLLGSALLIKQGLLHSGGTTGQGPQTIGGHIVAPLAAGPRAVYEHGGALWSAPENGPGLAQQLTPAGVRVAGWAVAPDGHTIAYVNAADGSIHIIRSDDQNDRAIAAGTSGMLPAGFWSSKAGAAVAAGLSWSPNGKQLAYVAADSSGQTVLHIVNVDGTHNASWGGAAAWTGTAVWSDDGKYLAFAQSASAGGQTISVYDGTTRQAYQLSAADPANTSASVARMAWLAGTPSASLTWAAATANGTMTGIFTQPAASGTSAIRLTPAGARYSAADFTAAGGNLWMVSTDGTLATLPVNVTGRGSATTAIGTTVTHIAWSPSGAAAAYVTANGQLGFWIPGATPVSIATQIVGTPVWSPDSARLAMQVSDGVVSLRISDGSAQALTRLASVTGAVALSWSPDSQALAVGSSSGVLIAGNGSINAVDGQAPAGETIVWTLAG